ncbi:hypothetical protein [Amycolatopsis sp. A1MSW2902]|uniref:hypothetical protein n=1 Tax=Amycolatopsis sp. A1MSW2902 TaxID=687413 RepID=UPI00307E3483
MTAFEPSPEVRRPDLPMYLVENPYLRARPGSRNTFGGRPILPEDEDWPECYCGERMTLFFQLDVPPDIPRFGGDHLLVFQWPVHNDAACLPGEPEQLPERYWENPHVLDHPGAFSGVRDGNRVEACPARRVHRTEHRPDGVQSRRAAVLASGSATARLRVRCRDGVLVRDSGVHRIREAPGRADQRHDSYGESYVLLLGNAVHLLACPEHCHPAAVWPVPQN